MSSRDSKYCDDEVEDIVDPDAVDVDDVIE